MRKSSIISFQMVYEVSTLQWDLRDQLQNLGDSAFVKSNLDSVKKCMHND